MKVFGASTPIGLGDLIYIKAMFEPIKHEYESINIRFHREIITRYNKDPSYNNFLDELGSLLFGEAPYKLTDEPYQYYRVDELVRYHGLTPYKPELADLLCSGTPLNLDGPYIVLNTKIRSLPQSYLDQNVREFWDLLNKLSEKYKIVVLGEKVIEMNKEYQIYTSENIYSLHTHIYNNMPHDRIIDRTVPALGITTPNLQQIKQDCLIMNQAKFVINFGIGGGFCLATAVANTVGYRYDDDLIADMVFSKEYPNAHITKDWNSFINKLRTFEDA
jgi:hypothetical protein